jgi:hypothetical protein
MRQCMSSARYTPAMPPPKVYAFPEYIRELCVKRCTNVHALGAKLGVDPLEMLKMIDGRVAPTKAALGELAKEVDSDIRYLEKLAEKIRKDLA